MYGSRFDYADPAFQQMVNRSKEFVRLAGSAEILLYNMFPWLRWCCGRWLVKRTQILEHTDNVIEEIKGLAQGLKDTLNPQDLRGFVDSFLVRQQRESDQPGSYFHNNNLIITVCNMFAAGTDTTGTTLRWGLLLMAKYPPHTGPGSGGAESGHWGTGTQVEDRRDLPLHRCCDP
ncbi:hypothetical protein SKAU_G00116430 [Synaphobranchus kaupii]|uniref:Uncharacterized protein n=1 Tax=Synaphobranchus kaupii TaxID=118154 RepID=A0A9Q1FMT6_SYNKA|nr:hypothetical protein SKAU_G00116430 [Synaphobranchus kaupii]